MQGSQSRIVTFVAISQFVPLVLFPWSLSVASAVFIAVLIALTVFLGWSLLRGKSWGLKLTIFVQGFNVIVRIITFFGNVYDSTSGVNVPLLLTYAVSIVLSVILLSYIDRPEVRLLLES